MVDTAVQVWKASLPRNQRSGIRAVSNEEQPLFGPWEGSEKSPDLGIRLRSTGELKWVMEVGFSQTSDSLKETARAWLEGCRGLDMVVLVNFEEDPPYRCPISADEDPSTLGITLPPDNISLEEIACEGLLGPATYKDLTWVGKICKISMETWVRGGDGKATQKGPARDLLHEATMEIHVEDLFPSPYHGTIVVDLDEFREDLHSDIRLQARQRCQVAVGRWRKRMGDDAKDKDYEE